MTADTRRLNHAILLLAALCACLVIPCSARAGGECDSTNNTRLCCGDAHSSETYAFEWLENKFPGGSGGAFAALAVDLAGNVIETGSFLDFPDKQYKIITLKYDTTGNCDTADDELWSVVNDSDPDGGDDVPADIAVDFDGFSYVAGMITSDETHANGSAAVLRYSPGGFLTWRRVISQPSTALEGTVTAVAVSPEGVVYVAGLEKNSGNEWFAARLNALTGDTEWVIRFEEGSVYGKGNPQALALDRRGNPYITGRMNVGGDADMVTMRLDPNSGSEVWMKVADDGGISGTDVGHAIAIDLECNVYVTGRMQAASDDVNETKFVTIKYDVDGNLLWRADDNPTDGFDIPSDLAVDLDGNVYVTGTSDQDTDASDYHTIKYDSSGSVQWVKTLDSGGPDGANTLALDFLGNAYVTGYYDDPGTASGTSAATVKYAGADGDEVWMHILEGRKGIDLEVDFGGGVFVAGTWLCSDGLDCNLSAWRYTQDFVSVPVTFQNSPNFQVEAASIWDPDLPSFFFDYPLFSLDWNEDWTLGGFEAGFGGEVSLATDGQIDLGLHAEASLGYFDATYPGIATITINNAEKLSAGDIIEISTSWELDPCARITSNGSPTIDAAVTVELSGAQGSNVDAEASIELQAFGATIVDTTLLDIAFNLPTTTIISVAALLAGDFAQGQWESFQDPNGIISGTVRYPQLAASGGPNSQGVLKSSVTELFFTLKASVTSLAATAAGVTTGKTVDTDDFFASIAFLDLFLRADLSMVQDLEMEMQATEGSSFKTPLVKLEFSTTDGNIFATQVVNLGETVTDVSAPEDDGEFDGIVNIMPTLMADAVFRNYTGLLAVPNIGFDTATATITSHAGEIELFNWSECLACFEAALGELPIEIYGTPDSPREWALEFPQYPLAPISLAVDTETILTASSQSFASMIIYDQLNPTQSSFNADVNGSISMLLYGDGFPTDETSQASICFYGQIQDIETERLNNKTLLVELPDRFRLLPGTARIYVTSSLGQSNSIDFTIEYPAPNLATVNPNLWAADPELATIPVSLIDGFTPAGNHTYIARRDYFIKMRDELWNDSTAGGVRAVDYFPEFDFDATPAFPLVSFDGVAMPRFVQPVDNGIHNIRLPESAYSSPGVVPVFIANPVPGGGMSNVINLTIAAPAPVISGLDPPSITPAPPVSEEGFENGEQGWTHMLLSGFGFDNWGLSSARSNSGDFSWYSGPSPGNHSETALESPDIDLTGVRSAALVFKHWYEFNGDCSTDSGYPGDGAVVEVWDGVQWVTLTPVGGYPETVSEGVATGCNAPAPLAGLDAYTGGDSGGEFISATFDLSAYSGQVIRIRFRVGWNCSDCTPDSSEGWYIDDLTIFGRGVITLQVQGPSNVPTFEGFEEPKFGNFTAASVVRWDGEDLPTTFFDSGLLYAELSAAQLVDFGNHNVSVFTPDNGSTYFEELRSGLYYCDGGSNDGVECDPDANACGGEIECSNLFWQGEVPSGCTVIQVVNGVPEYQCESAPIVFTVTYPNPVLTKVVPATVGACDKSFDGTTTYNLTVFGESFAPGAAVFVDGELRATSYVSDTLLEVTLREGDVTEVGSVDILVTNPQPSGGESNTMQLIVEMEDCNQNGLSDQCETVDGLTDDCTGNRIPDECESDCDGSGTADSCDIDDGSAIDCNANFVPDSCDITDGTSEDTDEDGIPDECQTGEGGSSTEPPVVEVGRSFATKRE